MWRGERGVRGQGKGGDSRFSSCVDQGWPEPACLARCSTLAVSGPGRVKRGGGCRAWGHGAWTRARPMERKQLWIRVENRKKGRVQAESSLLHLLFPLPGQLLSERASRPILGSVRPRGILGLSTGHSGHHQQRARLLRWVSSQDGA